jgi:hypothetical protein
VTTVGDNAFDNCYSLASVFMPNVTTIGDYVFTSCASLTSVSMPSVTTIGDYAFSNISTSAEFKNQTTETIDDWFGNSVFGSYWGPATITCSNGIVYAVWEDDMWTITITPAQ